LKFKELAGKEENYLALHALPRLAGLWETIPVFFYHTEPHLQAVQLFYKVVA
jgi:hypothetical protein